MFPYLGENTRSREESKCYEAKKVILLLRCFMFFCENRPAMLDGPGRGESRWTIVLGVQKIGFTGLEKKKGNWRPKKVPDIIPTTQLSPREGLLEGGVKGGLT